MLKSFKDRLRELKQTRGYCQEQTKLEFVAGLTRLMKRKGITNAALADRIDSSPAYVTKALRGDTNFTIDTMVKIVHAIGGRIHVHVADAETDVRWLEHIECSAQEPVSASRAQRPEKVEVNVSRILDKIQHENREIYA